ncbi:hypothetical protein CASFOL_035513 [Castilleja foliolosa]|uniref:Uncharacterized protein n=1 Tax=Castilleja foliolosa TaxID=1961234 RepID=A0ABD3BSV9_9LAMI
MMIMAYCKTPLFLLAVFVFMAIVSGQRTRPGFMYTRTRGSCTPRYWSRMIDSWPKMVPRKSTVSNVFGSRVFERYREDLTLLEAAAAGEDAFGKLLKQSTAALLNSYARKGYPYAAWEVKTLVIQALVSERAAAFQARRFREANENCV